MPFFIQTPIMAQPVSFTRRGNDVDIFGDDGFLEDIMEEMGEYGQPAAKEKMPPPLNLPNDVPHPPLKLGKKKTAPSPAASKSKTKKSKKPQAQAAAGGDDDEDEEDDDYQTEEEEDDGEEDEEDEQDQRNNDEYIADESEPESSVDASDDEQEEEEVEEVPAPPPKKKSELAKKKAVEDDQVKSPKAKRVKESKPTLDELRADMFRSKGEHGEYLNLITATPKKWIDDNIELVSKPSKSIKVSLAALQPTEKEKYPEVTAQKFYEFHTFKEQDQRFILNKIFTMAMAKMDKVEIRVKYVGMIRWKTERVTQYYIRVKLEENPAETPATRLLIPAGFAPSHFFNMKQELALPVLHAMYTNIPRMQNMESIDAYQAMIKKEYTEPNRPPIDDVSFSYLIKKRPEAQRNLVFVKPAAAPAKKQQQQQEPPQKVREEAQPPAKKQKKPIPPPPPPSPAKEKPKKADVPVVEEPKAKRVKQAEPAAGVLKLDDKDIAFLPNILVELEHARFNCADVEQIQVFQHLNELLNGEKPLKLPDDKKQVVQKALTTAVLIIELLVDGLYEHPFWNEKRAHPEFPLAMLQHDNKATSIIFDAARNAVGISSFDHGDGMVATSQFGSVIHREILAKYHKQLNIVMLNNGERLVQKEFLETYGLSRDSKQHITRVLNEQGPMVDIVTLWLYDQVFESKRAVTVKPDVMDRFHKASLFLKQQQ